MWLTRLTSFILQNRWKAVLFTFALTLVPVIGAFGIVIAALVTLRKGALEGALLTLVVTLAFLTRFYVVGNGGTAVPLFVWAAVGVAVLINILTWLFAAMLRSHKSWSAIIQVAALIGVFAISVIHIVNPDIAEWWGTELRYSFSQAASLSGMVAKDQAAVTISDAQMSAINATKMFATGFTVAWVLFFAIVQVVMARWWECIVFTPGMLHHELRNIRLGKLAGFFFIVSLVLAYLGNTVVLDIMPVLYMMFMVAGLSFIHYLLGLSHTKLSWFWVVLLYVAMIWGMPASVLLVSGLALLDIGLNFRKRFHLL